MDYKKAIGERIRKARDALNLSLEQLSRKTVVLSPSRISNYEQGLRLPKPQQILILSKALSTSPTYLMCLDEENDVSVEEAQLLRDWGALPENERRSYAKRISALALVYKETVPDERVADSYDKPKKPRAAKIPQK